MRNYYLFLVLVVSFLGNHCYAQNDVYFNQYASIRYLNNPAELTFNRKNGLYYFRRDQWLNSPLKSANNSILTGQVNVSRTVDLGLSMSQYNSGNAYSNSAYQLHLAWKGRVNDESNTYFSFGTNLKFGSLRTDFSNVLLFDPNDPQIPLTITSQNYWDVGTGFNFKADWFNIGLALNSLRGYSNINSNNFLFARTVTYNLGFNLMDADGGDWDTHISRPNIYLRVRSINNAVWQGEGFIDFNIHMGNEDQRNYTIVGVGVRRDFSTTYYNSILAHINLSFGGRDKPKLLLGVGPEFSTAPLGNVSSGNIEYIVGIEKGTKTDEFYHNLAKGDKHVKDKKWIEADECYEEAKNIFPNSILVKERQDKTKNITRAWDEFKQFKVLADMSFQSGNYSEAYEQILSAEKSLNIYKEELKNLRGKPNTPSEDSEIKEKKDQYEKAKMAIPHFEEGVQLFEAKKYVQALIEFEKSKTNFQSANVPLSGDLINKIEICKSIIKRQEEEERKERIKSLIVTAKEKFKNEDYTGCLYDLNLILNGLDPNNSEAKNLKKDAEQKYQEQELIRRQKECDEHYDLAEKLKGQGKLDEALNEINAAKDALETCERCDLLKTKIEKDIEQEKVRKIQIECNEHIARSEEFLKKKDFNLALSEINQALWIDNNCERCNELKSRIEVAQAREIENRYKDYISKGDDFFKSKAYNQAKSQYIAAQNIKYTTEVQDKIKDCDLQIENSGGDSSIATQKIYESSKNAVVLILCGQYNYLGDLVNVSQGTGFFISSSGIGITNYHVLDGMQNYLLFTMDGSDYKFDILGSNQTEDWVVFKVRTSNNVRFNYLEIANSTPPIGQKVYSIGYPLAGQVSRITGKITPTISDGFVNAEPTNFQIQNSCEINKGNSGGPLINSKGQVVGITSSSARDDEAGNLNYTINILSIPRYLMK